MEKYFCIGIIFCFLIGCSNPAQPENIKTQQFTVGTNDYVQSTAGHFTATLNCSLITNEILKFGSVSVKYQPYNQTYWIPFQWSYTQNNYFYSWNYYYAAGQVYLIFLTSNPNEKFPPDGYFQVTIFSRD